jgi:preprotein translocase subunit SecB
MFAGFRIEDIRLLSVDYKFLALLEEPPPETEEEQSEGEQAELSVELTCESHYNKKKRLLRIILGMSTKGQNPPFNLKTKMGGAFILDKDPEAGELKRLRHINCPAIIFPYLREFVSNMTSRAGLEPLYLPPVNFVNVSRRVKSKKPE